VLIHGPQGIGKTLMVRDVLSEMNLLDNTLVVQPKDLIGQDKSETIKKVFKAAKAMQKGKIENRFESKVVIIWFEEIDFICSNK
jgi:AAA+ superfamily predicted ATPase